MQDQILQNSPTDLKPKAGLTNDSRHQVAQHLCRALADSYLLMANTQGLHWNVEGPLFYSIHKLTEEQYEDLFEAIDEVAERIRALGFPAPQSIGQFQNLALVNPMPVELSVKAMIETLIKDNETTATRMRDAIVVAEEVGDVKTADLLTERVGIHQENAWMLRATIAEA